jgi:hypothetical protein
MKKILSRLVWIPVGIVLVLFLVANRQPVALSLDPFSVDHPAIATPPLWLWVWLMAALLVGFFLGVIGLWTSQGAARKLARMERRDLKSLRKELAAREADAAPPPADLPPDPAPVLEAR